MVFGSNYEISDYAKEYKKAHPVYAPQGSVTKRTVPIFTEAEVRALPSWEQSVLEQEKAGVAKRGRHLISESTPRIDPVGVTEVSRIIIKVREPTGDKLYYALDPVSGGKKGTEVDLEEEGLTGPALPPLKFPEIKLPSFPKIGWPSLPDFGISGMTKGIVGLVLLFIAFIVLLMAVGYSGLGGSAGRVGESEYKRRRK